MNASPSEQAREFADSIAERFASVGEPDPACICCESDCERGAACKCRDKQEITGADPW